MPEGHSIHRIALQFERNFLGQEISASSPQGRFAKGAAEISNHSMVESRAVGKNLFLGFDNDLWLRVHLGIYGAWDFAGEIQAGAALTTPAASKSDNHSSVVGEHEDSLGSIGAPRRTRLRMAEIENSEPELGRFPPEPIGQVRVRLLVDTAVADLRGPTICELLDEAGVSQVVGALGPDPLVDDVNLGEERFVEVAGKKRTPIAPLLMDQKVISGIGNIYRAEMLFRARINPHTLATDLPEETLRELWRDWVKLLRIGVETGQILTMDGLNEADHARALANRADRHWVYQRAGLPCRVCGTNIVVEVVAGRKLYWCPKCQA
ncbi:MAG: Fpg/Nei family DNA glycosylase [Cryobacterium sp.]|nr:Fpg/Nei family DNA glycosylase [Cryobacterium sp.]MBX3089067.1 Fpg/Nei family DNA glycosylase [Cryobacterium sp.]MCC7128207.1 Fpg/Nei family DNA glycosylase [Microbacteriaceae bacterium]MCO5294302.1 Fpg/Nei family DNA glycosylase [Homoserinimonas sp.]MCW5944625.1 Fpg/Nei family DNA glycosylase [Cryobacterium sp.]